jgi:hypothetical protein
MKTSITNIDRATDYIETYGQTLQSILDAADDLTTEDGADCSSDSLSEKSQEARDNLSNVTDKISNVRDGLTRAGLASGKTPAAIGIVTGVAGAAAAMVTDVTESARHYEEELASAVQYPISGYFNYIDNSISELECEPNTGHCKT